MRALQLVGSSVLLLSFVACTAPMADLAKSPDVSSCKVIGEATVPADTTNGNGSVDDVTALRQKAAEKGATDVVVENDPANNRTLKGRLYACEAPAKPPSRSEQRSGF
ncbi:MAG: hypothetical protein ABI183_22940 [Polyangiaceae bacterium]